MSHITNWTISDDKGGLGLQHPRCTAIPTLVLNMKRCIKYSSQGVWVGCTSDPLKLHTAITSLFAKWKTSQNPAFQIFRRYAYDISQTCVHGGASLVDQWWEGGDTNVGAVDYANEWCRRGNGSVLDCLRNRLTRGSQTPATTFKLTKAGCFGVNMSRCIWVERVCTFLIMIEYIDMSMIIISHSRHYLATNRNQSA